MEAQVGLPHGIGFEPVQVVIALVAGQRPAGNQVEGYIVFGDADGDMPPDGVPAMQGGQGKQLVIDFLHCPGHPGFEGDKEVHIGYAMHGGLLGIGAGIRQGGQPASCPPLDLGGNMLRCLFGGRFRPPWNFIFFEDGEDVFIARHGFPRFCLCSRSSRQYADRKFFARLSARPAIFKTTL